MNDLNHFDSKNSSLPMNALLNSANVQFMWYFAFKMSLISRWIHKLLIYVSQTLFPM